MNQSKAYCIYNNMLDTCPNVEINEELTFSCQAEQNELFFFLAAELVKLGADNPLQPGDPGYDAYEDLKFFYKMWPNNKPECSFKKRFLLAAYQLCMLQPNNIFDEQSEPEIEFVSLEALQEREYEKAEAEDIATGTYVPVAEPQTAEDRNHMLGVLPFDEDDEFFKEDYSEPEAQQSNKQNWSFRKNKKSRGRK